MPQSVYFESLCGDDPFWNGSLTWNNSWPQFTECFQNTALIWVPCTLVWLLSLFYGPYLYRRNLSPLPVSALHVAKMVLCILIIIVSLVDMLELYSTVPESSPALAEVTGYIIKILTMFLVMLLLFMERRKGLISSTIQFIFWFLFFLGNIVPFYSKIILQEYNQYILKFTMFYIVFFFITLSLVLHSISEKLQRRRRGVKKPCPSTESSFLSQLTFWWLKSLIVLGYKKPLEEKDIWDLELIDKSKSVVSTFERNWLKEKAKLESKQQRDDAEVSPTEKTPLLLGPVKQKEKSKSSLLKVLLKSYGLRLLLAHMGKLLYDVVIFLNPVILRFLIDFVENKEEEEWKGYVYAVGLALCGLIQSFCFQHVFHESWRVGMRVKTAVIAAIYKKALTMSSQARKASTVGEIVNMMSVDAQYLLDMSPYLWSLWSGPLQCIVSIIMLFNTLGPSVFSGLAVMILLVPVNIFISYRYQQLQEEQMKEKDHRIKLTNEVLNGIKILKLYAWEIPFKEKILEIRERELNCLRKAAKLDAFAVFSWTVAPYLVSLATFGTYIFISKDHYLSPQIAFVSLSLFNILRFAINLTPLVITDIVKANVSLKRMNAFLNHDDLDMSSVGHNPSKGYTISVSDGSFVWDPEIGPCLKDINLKVLKGQLVAVVGQVGSGKSSLISAVLGEMQKIKGQVDIKGSVAYVPQEAWIQNATVRDNILFGREYTEHYHDVLHACALVQDLEILPGGDMTEIGEKGINLSGGQKQRVSLARAVYSDADIYLLDDPLSAVDANVGKHIFENLIGSEGLLAHKTRILVTHGIQWLSKVDVIVVLVHGRITEMGSSEDLLSSSGAFSQFLKNYLREKNLKEDNSEISEVTSRIFERLTSVHSETELSVEDGAHRSFSETSYNSKSLRDIRIQRTKSLELSIKEETTVTNVERLIEDEKSEIGQVKWSVFAAYARCIGIRFVVLIFGVYTLFNISSVASNLWLSKWTEDPVLSNRSLAADSPVYRKQNDFYLGIYGALGVLQSICVLLFSYTALMKMLAASGRLHSEMLSNIIRCQMAFFDTTPIGRIVNRFSKDVDIIDTLLPNIFPQWIDSFFLTITTLVVISYSTPIFLVVVLPVTVIYLLIQRAFIPTCRQLKRLESTTRSPIYNHFGETITGASVIRAFGAEQRFIDESARRVDNNQAYFFAGASSKRWVGLWLELLGSCIVLAAAVFAVISRNDNRTNGGLVGLSISYALEITMTLAWFLRLTSDLETNIVSVERVKEYIDVPTEAAWRKDYDYFPQKWPASGIVDFNSYGTRYRPGLDLVLRNITLNIADGEKVGIVGRTGAGKSSLTLSLFRLIEAACGNIDVDHLGIERLGLHDLRSRLTILPQDPLLFSGTLRMNLDPFGKYSDDEIWSALQHSHLKTYIENLPGQLEHECGEGGLNLSVGQRQLLCLARSLLRKSKVLILDEATAAVDLETDELIQRTMREEFEDCTVLTIAHRLNTIMDYDRILVMENGEVQEFDKPKTLLKNKDSLFYKLVKDAGIVD